MNHKYILGLFLCLSLLIASPTFADTTSYLYDELDRLKEVCFAPACSESANRIVYTYDEIGNLLGKTVAGPNIATINATASSGGRILPSGIVTMFANSSKTFSVIPSDGYRISEVKVDGVSRGNINTPTYSYNFGNVPAGSHTIEATFLTNSQYWSVGPGRGILTPILMLLLD